MKISLAVATLAFPALAAAHDFRVERAPDGFVVRYGHDRQLLPFDASRVKRMRCIDAAGAEKDLRADARAAPRELRVTATCAVVGVFDDGGYWSLTPDGEVNLPRDRATNVVKAWASRQYAKWIDPRSPRATTVLGDELELVPVTDLAKAHVGDKVTLRVLSSAKPISKAVVAVGHHAIGETDSRGEIRLRLRTAGVESISASVRRAHATPEADAEVLEASLTFEVSK